MDTKIDELEDVYELAIEESIERTYIIQLISIDGFVSRKRVKAENFKFAFQIAERMVQKRGFDRIISIEEVDR